MRTITREQYQWGMFRAVCCSLENGERVEATSDTGIPRVGWGKVLSVDYEQVWPWNEAKHTVHFISPLGGVVKKAWHSIGDIRIPSRKTERAHQ